MAMDESQMAEEMGISLEEVRARREKALEDCTCTDCPTHVEGDTPVAYCFPTIGRSDEITSEKGCICGDCPVYEDMDLDHGYYCTRGSEAEQAG